MERIYLDYAATTPMDEEVKKAMAPYFSDKFGNPSSLHSFGQEAMAAVDESREKIAQSINADFREIIFTGSATEANNLALRGVVKSVKRQMLNVKCPRIIVSAIEHDSILETCRDLERENVEIIYLPVNKQGVVDLKKLKESLNERTVLVSIMYANNEIGTIQPITKIAKIIRNFRDELRIKNYELSKKNNIHNSSFMLHNSYPFLHTDAVQAFQFLNCDVNPSTGELGVDPTHNQVMCGVDLMTLSAHKIYGPKGIGVLYINSKLQNPNYKQIQNSMPTGRQAKFQILNPIVTGGEQEFGLRSGTENVPAIVGFAKAVKLVSNSRELENKRVKQLTDYFWRKLKKISPKAEVNGIMNAEVNGIMNQELRIMNQKLKNKSIIHNSLFMLPNILNIYFPNQNAQDLLMALDLNGIAVSSGSACSARATKPSHVLKAIGLSDKKIKNSLRFSLGKFTTKEQINHALKIIKKIIK